MCLDSSLYLWLPGRLKIGSVSLLGSSVRTLMYAVNLDMDNSLKWVIFKHSKRADKKRCTVEVRWGIFSENLTDFIPMKAPSHLASSSRRYFGTRSLNRENSEEIANYRSLFCISSAYFHFSNYRSLFCKSLAYFHFANCRFLEICNLRNLHYVRG